MGKSWENLENPLVFLPILGVFLPITIGKLRAAWGKGDLPQGYVNSLDKVTSNWKITWYLLFFLWLASPQKIRWMFISKKKKVKDNWKVKSYCSGEARPLHHEPNNYSEYTIHTIYCNFNNNSKTRYQEAIYWAIKNVVFHILPTPTNSPQFTYILIWIVHIFYPTPIIFVELAIPGTAWADPRRATAPAAARPSADRPALPCAVWSLPEIIRNRRGTGKLKLGINFTKSC